jgi:hypothetical protein
VSARSTGGARTAAAVMMQQQKTARRLMRRPSADRSPRPMSPAERRGLKGNIPKSAGSCLDRAAGAPCGASASRC